MSDGTPPRQRETSFIETSGGLLTEQLIYKLRDKSCSEAAVQPQTFAHPTAEAPESGTALEAHISEVWEDLQERWDEVTREYELFEMDVSEARQKWILKLFEALDFEPEYQQANLTAGMIEANLSHFGWTLKESVTASGNEPATKPPILHAVQPDPDRPLESNDHRGAAGRQKGPHDELQQYLNADDDVLWSVVTDGLKLRVLRDYHHTYTRGYVEFDLENIFTERNYGDFRALYRLCHASRFVPSADFGEEDESRSAIEQLYQVSLSTGVKIGQDLQSNVVSAIETLGNGFMNADIEAELAEGGQDATEAYYQDLLYIVYRLLFLLFAEQRGMMSDRNSLYTEEYSVTTLRERAERREKDDRNTDLWEGLEVTFELVGDGDERLNVPGYNGGLFDNDNLEYILNSADEDVSETEFDPECPNANLLSAIFDLTYIEQDGYRQRISYADLGVEEIGAVYESLLEFTPQLAETAVELEDRSVSPGTFYLDDRGIDRKDTGSYYTDPRLIQNLVQSSLKPIVEDRLSDADNRNEQEQKLLSITVCDPACGSGAFLIAANNYLAKRLAQIRSETTPPREEKIRQARRSVVQHCIYGVDKNQMAVELAKVSLWINSAVANKPLNFLDHRIRQGNSLIGTSPELISNGLSDEAYDTSKGRDHHVGTDLRRLVRNESDNFQSELDWYDDDESEYVSLAEKLDEFKEEDITDIQEKAQIHRKLRNSEDFQSVKLAHDVWTAAFFWPLEKYEKEVEKYESKVADDEKTRKVYLKENKDEFPTPETIEKVRRSLPKQTDEPIDDLEGLKRLRARAEKISDEEGFFHWPLEFPQVYSNKGGFDCILGNPPWDKLELKENEFFAVSAPHIADSSLKQSEREALIEELEEENPSLYREHEQAEERIQNQKDFIKHSGRFPLTSHGIINLYAPFAGLALREINEYGSAGIVVPTGIATDSNTQEYFRTLVENKHLSSIYDFVNKKGIFPDVDGRYKFSLMTIFGNKVPQDQFDLCFYLEDVDNLDAGVNVYQLSRDDITTVNPNTRTCPTFRTKDDAETTLRIYKGGTILRHEEAEKEDWSVEFSRMFNAGDDSPLFEWKHDLEQQGLELDGNLFKSNNSENYLPVYESKMIHQFDHRFATYRGVSKEKTRDKKPREIADNKKDGNTSSLPPYWINKKKYDDKWNNDDWHVAIRNVTNATNRRTVIATILPKIATEHSINHMLECDAEQAAVLTSHLNSYVLDYVARQKIGGENLSHYVLKQLPIPTRQRLQRLTLDGKSLWRHIVDLSLKLIYTNDELQRFAEDLDYSGGPYEFTNPGGESREDIRYELESLICHAYNIESSDFTQIFSTFEQIRDEDIEQYGYYRTRDEIKQRFEEMAPNLINSVGEAE